MVDFSQSKNTKQSAACRRRARRVAMPVEVELLTDGRKVSAVIRDVSVDEQGGASFFGIGLHHNEAIPLDVSVGCRLVSSTDALPALSQVTLMWTRQFGADGFLSGGRMYAVVAETCGVEQQ